MASSHRQQQSSAVERDQLTDAIVMTAFATTAVLTRVGADHDLSLTQLRVLAILRDRRLRMAELADYLGLEKSTMTGLVDRAEKRGLLVRAADPADGRAVDVLLTAAGAQLAVRLQAQVTQSLARMTGQLSTSDRRRLGALLERLLSAPPS